MGAKLSVHRFGLGKFDAFSKDSSRVHKFSQSRMNQTEGKRSTNDVATSCKYQMFSNKTNIMVDHNEETHQRPISNEMSSLEANCNEIDISSTNGDVENIQKGLRTLEIREQMIRHGRIASEHQETEKYELVVDVITKANKSLLKCDATGDAHTNQVSFRTTSALGEHSLLGFSKTQSGDIVYTAFIRMKNTRVDEYEILKKISARKITGLEKQLNCRIKLYEEAFKMRAQIVFKLEIRGSDYRDVLKCRNSLPNCITERLISADSFQEGYI
ncbi:unnamed protein product [Hymenolepis diminuta]|uniref:Helitron helicase n=1 Tax=Hymenolepis diminuta TaxID=6216 RepID=A0A0R3SNG0_HYMDI|nr:unnamed protein product [Hymenolepis diminuta]VUZ52889.1 unnamed protein product [Hymenolepis diminuta]